MRYWDIRVHFWESFEMLKYGVSTVNIDTTDTLNVQSSKTKLIALAALSVS
jgi:hypothetical protein